MKPTSGRSRRAVPSKRKKLTARGTPRLTREERSQIMIQAWKRRRAKGEAPPKKKRKKPNLVRREAMLASWRRRWRNGVRKQAKKKLLSREQRSKIAKRAAKKRFAGEKARHREDLKLLNLPKDASRKDIAKAFTKHRRRLGLSPKAVRLVIRDALRAEAAALKNARRRKQIKAAHAGGGAVAASLEMTRRAAA